MSQKSIDKAAELIKQLKEHLQKTVVGSEETFELVCIVILARGHLLIEDAPGLGKTTLAKALSASMSLEFKRVQCTPDLLPSDITGISIFNQKEQEFEFIPGPIFTDFLLADEINRTSPRTQSALLEAMAERTVTIERKTHELSKAFTVIATQNPVEFRGTYPLPEAQLDRFLMRISMGYPSPEQEREILELSSNSASNTIKPVFKAETLSSLQLLAEHIQVEQNVKQYIVDLVQKTREHSATLLGASPRGGIGLMQGAKALALMQGKSFVTPDMVQQIAPMILNHRIVMKNAAHNAQSVVDEVVDQIPIPGMPKLTTASA